jgi:hypothetical protein
MQPCCNVQLANSSDHLRLMASASSATFTTRGSANDRLHALAPKCTIVRRVAVVRT